MFKLPDSCSSLFQFCIKNLVFDVPVCCPESSPVFEPKSFLLLFQAMIHLSSDPGFGVGLYFHCFDYFSGIYAKTVIVCSDSDPVIQDSLEDVLLGA